MTTVIVFVLDASVAIRLSPVCIASSVIKQDSHKNDNKYNYSLVSALSNILERVLTLRQVTYGAVPSEAIG